MHDALPLFLPIRKRGPVSTPRLALPDTIHDVPTAIAPAPAPTADVIHAIDDAHLVAILESPLKPGETAVAGYARKERELAAAFARLSVAGALAMRRRLATPASTDQLATKFARLMVERRTRLIQFLAAASRRAALAGGK